VGSLFEAINGDSVTLFKYIFSFYVLIILVMLARAHGILTWTVGVSVLLSQGFIRDHGGPEDLPGRRLGDLSRSRSMRSVLTRVITKKRASRCGTCLKSTKRLPG
jgi:hypothetical protein